MNRLQALQDFCEGFHGKKLSDRLSESEFVAVVDFIGNSEDLDAAAFELSLNRMFLDGYRPTNWAIMQEILSCTNTRARNAK